jgi:hypothetical protein
VSLGEPEHFGPLLRQALERVQLCSSATVLRADPRADSSIHAACERGNRYLDRATISATLARDDVSYFPVM